MAVVIKNPTIIPFDKCIRDVTALPEDNIDAAVVYRLTEESKVSYWRYEEEIWLEYPSFIDSQEAPTESIADGVWHRVKLENSTEYYVATNGQLKKYIDVEVADAALDSAQQEYDQAIGTKDREIANTKATNAAELAAKDAEKDAAIAEIEEEKQEAIQALQLTYDAYMAELISGSSTGELVIPEGTTQITDYAFYGRKYTSITIPASVEKIGEYAFGNCTACAAFDLSLSTSIPILGVGAFDGINVDTKIIVQDNLYDSWIVAENWSTYSINITKVSEVTTA